MMHTIHYVWDKESLLCLILICIFVSNKTNINHQNTKHTCSYQMNNGNVPGVEKCVINSFSVAMPEKKKFNTIIISTENVAN
jgi:hypothetical protein